MSSSPLDGPEAKERLLAALLRVLDEIEALEMIYDQNFSSDREQRDRLRAFVEEKQGGTMEGKGEGRGERGGDSEDDNVGMVLDTFGHENKLPILTTLDRGFPLLELRLVFGSLDNEMGAGDGGGFSGSKPLFNGSNGTNSAAHRTNESNNTGHPNLPTNLDLDSMPECIRNNILESIVDAAERGNNNSSNINSSSSSSSTQAKQGDVSGNVNGISSTHKITCCMLIPHQYLFEVDAMPLVWVEQSGEGSAVWTWIPHILQIDLPDQRSLLL
jgi:hypothetical protein